MKFLHVVRCIFCPTLYPHENVKHQGPCKFCWENLTNKRKYSRLLKEAARERFGSLAERLEVMNELEEKRS